MSPYNFVFNAFNRLGWDPSKFSDDPLREEKRKKTRYNSVNTQRGSIATLSHRWCPGAAVAEIKKSLERWPSASRCFVNSSITIVA